MLGNGGWIAVKRDDAGNARTGEYRQAVFGIEARETVARKQRPIDLLHAILPSTPTRDCRKEGLDPFPHELIVHRLLVPRARPYGKPIFRVRARAHLCDVVEASNHVHEIIFGIRTMFLHQGIDLGRRASTTAPSSSSSQHPIIPFRIPASPRSSSNRDEPVAFGRIYRVVVLMNTITLCKGQSGHRHTVSLGA